PRRWAPAARGAVGGLRRKQAGRAPALAAHPRARLAGRVASARGAERLRDDDARHARVLVEERTGRVVDHALDDALDLGITRLGLGLALELRVLHLHVQDAVQPLAHVVARE